MKRSLKYDQDKPAFDLLDPDFELEVVNVLTFGAKKYAKDGWKAGMALGKCIAGIRRHLNAIQRGEYMDPESGHQHTAHATCGLQFLHFYIRHMRTDVPDDRWRKRRGKDRK